MQTATQPQAPRIEVLVQSEHEPRPWIVRINGDWYWYYETPDGFEVRKDGTNNKYRVYLRAGKATSCNCPAWNYRHQCCRHMRSANEVLKQW